MRIPRLLLLVLCWPMVSLAEWQPKQAPLMTKWAKDVDPKKPLPEYPRPQMVRDQWSNLNGLWEYSIRPKAEGRPDKWDGEILVPFPVESALSGVMKTVGPDNRLWYRRTFTLPQADGKTHGAWADKNILLHFGAVDWETTVWVNGREVGSHKGGYDPFSIDVTAALKNDGPNELVVSVWDGSDDGYQPRGKQVRNPHGIWYTPTTGIWQTVWMEPVPKTYIRGVKLVPHLEEVTFLPTGIQLPPGKRYGLGIELDIVGDTTGLSFVFHCSVPDLDFPGRTMDATQWGSLSLLKKSPEFLMIVPVNRLSGKRPYLWEPDFPVLHNLTLKLVRDEGLSTPRAPAIDAVESYTAMRHIALGKDEKGITRLMLNGKPVFQHGPLDQGFWPDGLYTAPTDEALRFDIEITKQYGFNMIRKHVKVEPARWYYHCDKLGMLVWQDMPSGDKHAQWDPFGKHDNTETTRSKESSDNFNREWKAIIDSLRNHPCIVMWVPFNEGWGQANTVAVTKWTKEHDPTRLVNCASGGNDFPVGDVIDVHRYPVRSPPNQQPIVRRCLVSTAASVCRSKATHGKAKRTGVTAASLIRCR